MRAVSTFSGVGGLDLGLERAGVETVAQVEYDVACRDILARHWPDVPRFADITEVDPDELPDFDLLHGGFPCQDVSLAGRRRGLAGERSGLFHSFVRLAAVRRPRWLLLENVPGLLSSNDGADFGVVIAELARLGYRVEWRILDAQYFGVAQRRRRVFIVGRAGGWAASGPVLVEPPCRSGHSPSRRSAGAAVASAARNGADADRADDGLVRALTASDRYDGDTETFVVTVGFDDGATRSDDVTGTLPATGSAHSEPLIVSLGFAESATILDDQAATLQAHHARAEHRSTLVVHATQDPIVTTDHTPALAARSYYAVNQRDEARELAAASSLVAGAGVRRLTPTECERLQGFSDGWTDGQPDTTRYRQLGNAVAVPVAEWIGRRLMRA